MIDDDIESIIGFIRSPEELFFMWHGATWPLTREQMINLLGVRVDPTTFLLEGTPVGFAALASFKPGLSCGLGSVVVDPKHRNQGFGHHMVRTMVDRALLHHQLPEMEVRCYNINTEGLLLYANLGLRPWRIEERVDPRGCRVALVIYQTRRDEWIARRTAA